MIGKICDLCKECNEMAAPGTYHVLWDGSQVCARCLNDQPKIEISSNTGCYEATLNYPVAFVEVWNHFRDKIHQTAKEKGWWDTERNNGELIALMHSELSEALEYLRKGNGTYEDDKIPEFLGIEAELADCIIRIMDMSAARGYRIAEAILAKMEYNNGRERKHGKAF